jgi:kynurenine 3-monooxygenase
MKKATVVGAGLVGSLWTALLAKRGYRVDVYERRTDSRKAGYAGGRSINLALSNRGWKALERAGLAEAIAREAIPMSHRVMHAVDGSLVRQPYGKDGQAIYSVSRGGLNEQLMTLAEQSGNVHLHFDRRCVDVDLKTGAAAFESGDGSVERVEPGLLFATDGAYSAIRSAMIKTDRYQYQQQYIDHGYKELHIPAGPNGAYQMEKNALHIWPRGGYMLIALPNPDGSFTLTLFFAWEGPESFASLPTTDDAEAFFARIFPDALSLMPDFRAQWDSNPASSLVIMRCDPWQFNGTVALIGDAAHAIVPFYGQGMNAGFEDCTVLDDLLDAHGEDWANVLPQYSRKQKPNGDAIAELALLNFIEMRDLVGQPEFLLQKKIEAWFSNKHPDRWTPLYTQVTFSHTPYSEALANGRRQEAIMREVMALPGIEERWDGAEVEALLLERTAR